ncbi:MAG: hypothetical protein WD851_15830 [Pirellulales bacterium]
MFANNHAGHGLLRQVWPNGVNSPFNYSGESVTYAYDDRGQLILADYSTQTDESYAYDDNGNRTNGCPSRKLTRRSWVSLGGRAWERKV